MATAYGGVPPEAGKASIKNMYIVYIIQSQKTGRYYIGVTTDIKKRLDSHNRGANKSTCNRGPWKLVYKEEFNDKSRAWYREKQIKKFKGGEAFKKLVNK